MRMEKAYSPDSTDFQPLDFSRVSYHGDFPVQSHGPVVSKLGSQYLEYSPYFKWIDFIEY